MPLTPIGDIGTATLSEKTGSETLTWTTQTDWDNAVDEAGVVHEDPAAASFAGVDVIQLGYPTFDRGGSALELYCVYESGGAADLSGNGRDGTVGGTLSSTTGGAHGSDTLTDTSTGDGIEFPYSALIEDGSTPFTWSTWIYWDGGSNKNGNHRAFGFDTTEAIGIMQDGSQDNGGDDMLIRWANSNIYSFGVSGSNFQGQWVHLAVTYDGGGVLDWYWNGSKVNGVTNASWSNSENAMATYSVWRNGDFPGESWHGRQEYARVYSRQLSSSEVTALYNAGTQGYLETATKSVSSSGTPDLQNLQYSLNGQSIDLKVIGSPGTASEEIVTQTLDGATSYTLTWSNSHTDFRVRPELSTSNFETTPTFSQAELVT